MVNIKLAEIPIQMNNCYSNLEQLCRGYETEEEPRICLSVSREELEKERALQAENFSDGYLETVCMYRKLAMEALRHQVFILHAAVIEVDGQGYAFLAPSGTGKTTQSRLWLAFFGERARMINGDKPLVRMIEHAAGRSFIAYGTPWCGKEGLGCNAFVPLKALFLVERAEQPECVLAEEGESIDRVFRQILMPESVEQLDLLLGMMDGLIENVPCYILRCNRDLESVNIAYDTVNPKNQ